MDILVNSCTIRKQRYAHSTYNLFQKCQSITFYIFNVLKNQDSNKRYLWQVFTELGKRLYLDIMHVLNVNSVGHLKKQRCNPLLNLEFDDVWYQRVARENDRMFGCSVPWHPITYSKVTKKKIQICNDSSTGLKALKHMRLLHDSHMFLDSTPCANFEFFLGLPMIDNMDNDRNEAFIRMYLKNKIKIKTMVLNYDFTILAADIGGYAGICLGVSAVDIVRASTEYLLKKVHSSFG